MKTTRPVIAWTGGSQPRKPSEVGRDEAAVCKYLFEEQVATWFAYWGDYPDWDTLHIFWRRARHDAHATYRGEREDLQSGQFVQCGDETTPLVRDESGALRLGDAIYSQSAEVMSAIEGCLAEGCVGGTVIGADGWEIEWSLITR